MASILYTDRIIIIILLGQEKTDTVIKSHGFLNSANLIALVSPIWL